LYRTLTIEYQFRFAYTPGWSGAANMEFDRRLGEESPPDLPLVRFYTWDIPTISFGCNQNPARRLDQELCRQEGIPVVKRPTGGRELLHGHDLCYCAAIPIERPVGGVEARRIFAAISATLVEALRAMGIDAQWSAFAARPRLADGPCFTQADSGEITVSGRKLVASAQRVYERCIIQEGSIPLFRPEVDLTRYLKSGDHAVIRRRIDEVAAYLYEVSPETMGIAPPVDNFRKAFERYYGTAAGSPKAFPPNFHGII
jgi:lipoate-protein ligase A